MFLVNIFLYLHLIIVLFLYSICRYKRLIDCLNNVISFFLVFRVRIWFSWNCRISLLDSLIDVLLDVLLVSIFFYHSLKYLVSFHFIITLIKVRNGSRMDLIAFYMFNIFVEWFSCNSFILTYCWSYNHFLRVLSKRRLTKTFFLCNHWWTLQSILFRIT